MPRLSGKVPQSKKLINLLFPNYETAVSALEKITNPLNMAQLDQFMRNLEAPAAPAVPATNGHVVVKPAGKVDSATVISVLETRPKGLRNDELQKILGVKGDVIVPILQSAMAAGVIEKKGHKRATVYFVK